MPSRYLISFVFILFCNRSVAQERKIDSSWSGDVRITIDQFPVKNAKQTIVCFFALPNGNSTEWTMGKKMAAGDNWHYDIQHIAAQTSFIRNKLNRVNFTVVYLENKFRSWPSWKEKHPDFRQRLPAMIDSITATIKGKNKIIYLSGHSGGGSLVFGYLAGVTSIPSNVKRIIFLDSDYGYDSSYYGKLHSWLATVKDAALNVFAYDDSKVVFNGKRLVSDTGGTWYRSHLLLSHLQKDISFDHSETDSLDIYRSKDKRVQFYFKKNIDLGIYHTQQVELNGFIHSILCGTKHEGEGYEYYGPRAYSSYIN